MLSASDWQALWVTIKLATLTTVILLLISIPLAWWLARENSVIKRCISALVTLPLVLPPTVIGFYFLLLMGSNGLLGKLSMWVGYGTLAFSFTGLVIASVIYSLPFVVYPIKSSFEAIDERPLEVAAISGASPLDVFLSVVIPLAKPGIISAAILGFIHTVGEFGVVLMIGGSIPGETRVISVQIYDHVEVLDYFSAHKLSLLMVLFSFGALLALQVLSRTNRSKAS